MMEESWLSSSICGKDPGITRLPWGGGRANERARGARARPRRSRHRPDARAEVSSSSCRTAGCSVAAAGRAAERARRAVAPGAQLLLLLAPRWPQRCAKLGSAERAPGLLPAAARSSAHFSPKKPQPSALRMTEVQIDSSQLPPVQDVCRDFAVLEDGALAYCLQEQEIEQHYASNIQKNQLVQRDIRIAKKLQDVEEEESRLQASEEQKQIEENDSKIARAIQEDIRRQAEESRQREKRDQEIAKWLQDLEEEESCQQKQRRRSLARTRDDGIEPLSWAMTELDLQSQKQLQQDEELAQRLQEEEQARARARQNQERHDDYRAAQVAQDEEIARYMQDQELKAQWTSLGKDPKTESIEEAHSLPGRRQSQSQESCQKGALKSCEAASLLQVQPLDRSAASTRGGPTSAKLQMCRNIAEDLDPTFQAKRTEPPTADRTVLCSQGAGPAHPVPVDGFFDYLDDASESTFVSPTKRQPEKVGYQKSKDKKEGCKQQ
ncbi:coiled-coil domain-containing protein 50-like [Tiliqua scincoides]|uniref:coiled-coil domain-containing protein 50-like n=1 Tax=Tiliqua scincoides TaxID=71010 RepID=UPI003461CD41